MRIYVVKKAFGDKVILSQFYAEFPEKSVSVLSGPSGAGKTTLLRLLAGLDVDYSGTMEDRPLHPVFLFQEDRLVETVSVLTNLKAVNPDVALIQELLDAIGLKGEGKTLVKDLSGGMKRRVAIVRMLLLDGDAYFLDEPFTGLDDEAKAKAAALVRAYTKNSTVVVVSHDKEDGELLGAQYMVNVGGKENG